MSVSTIDLSLFLDQYEFAAPYEVENRESGMNNTTRMVSAGVDRFVLRVYNNHKDAEIVKLEHEVLKALQEKSQAFPYQIPIPVQNKNGETLCIAMDGTIGALFRYINGERPSSSNDSHVFALGKAAAHLTIALSEIDLLRDPIYTPYYLLESTYASMDANTFIAMAERSKELAARRACFIRLQEERNRLISVCDDIDKLPKQWIHGDLVFNNTVAEGDEITGILDFEFSTIDVRAMELAVIVVDLIRAEDPAFAARVKLLIQGYLKFAPLTDEEMKYLPSLMKLRLLDVALHFAVRLKEGLDEEHVLCRIIDHSDFALSWIKEYGEVEGL